PGSPVHPLPYVLGDAFIKILLIGGEFIRNRLSDSLRKERFPVEGEQILLDHAPHEAAGVRAVYAGSELAFETVAVEQGQEELEVLLLARMGGGCHQQQVPGAVA